MDRQCIFILFGKPLKRYLNFGWYSKMRLVKKIVKNFRYDSLYYKICIYFNRLLDPVAVFIYERCGEAQSRLHFQSERGILSINLELTRKNLPIICLPAY